MFRSRSWIAAVALVAVLAACSSAGPATPDRSVRASRDASADASAAAGDPSPNPLHDTRPPLNAQESKIIDALATLGIEGKQAELNPFRHASIWAELGGEAELFIHANPVGTDNSDFSVLAERRVAEITVQRIEHSSGIVRDRFECAGATYGAEGAVPPGFKDFEAFLSRLIAALGCGDTSASPSSSPD
ncbi:MAG: hypothetical protein H0X16_07905 [Chloroflexi bacterium]|nr:hypothetical protein [Chloroflexota bacterium]